MVREDITIEPIEQVLRVIPALATIDGPKTGERFHFPVLNMGVPEKDDYICPSPRHGLSRNLS